MLGKGEKSPATSAGVKSMDQRICSVLTSANQPSAVSSRTRAAVWRARGVRWLSGGPGRRSSSIGTRRSRKGVGRDVSPNTVHPRRQPTARPERLGDLGYGHGRVQPVECGGAYGEVERRGGASDGGGVGVDHREIGEVGSQPPRASSSRLA